MDADVLVVGAGVAGLSAAAGLARHGRVIVVEAEDALGRHSSGRSVSLSHFGIGGAVVRGLTAASRPFFEDPPPGFSDAPLARPFPTLYFAAEEQAERLQALAQALSQFTNAAKPLGPDEMRRLCPALRTGEKEGQFGLLDPGSLKLEADALLQGFARALKAGGGALHFGGSVRGIAYSGAGWQVELEGGTRLAAPVLVNAAGAWADALAARAGVRPLGLQPKRRTVIAVEPPPEHAVARWPFVHSVAADFYMLPEAGRLLVSSQDEVDDAACDAQPEPYDIALAVDRLEHHTTLAAARIAHRWAGLRTFAADRVPVAGFDRQAPGFFWLAGQGGYGFQTAPAMALATEALITGATWPAELEQHGVSARGLAPDRLMMP